MNTPFLYHAQTTDGLSCDNDLLTVVFKTEAIEFDKVQVRHEPDNEEYLVDLHKTHRQGRLQCWEATFVINKDRPLTHYVFKVVIGTQQYWLDAKGVSKRIPAKEFHFKYNATQQPPEWVSKQVFYQIFPDRFCNQDPALNIVTGEYQVKNGTRDVIAKSWGEPVSLQPGEGGIEFYGGDLAGIESKLDYLQDLGITSIYLNPVFSSLSNHKYDTTDYFNIDPHLGTNQQFASLTANIHQREMKIVLDAVFNHTSAEHPWFDKSGKTECGAFHHPESPYRDYYFFQGESKEYIGWKGVSNLPVLNFENQLVKDYIYQSDDAVIKHWLRSPYNVDGWRFDVIHMLGEGEGAKNNAHYVQEFRKASKQENKDAYVLGEHFFEASSWLQGDQEDGSMNYYGFAHPLRALLAKQDISYDPIDIDACDFVDWLLEAKAKLPWANQLTQLNQMDSHDTARFISLVNGDQALMKIASTLLMTYVGAPCLYYGTEIGLEGGNDPDNRRCFPWGEVENSQWFSYYQSLIHLRTSSHALQKGWLHLLHVDEKSFVFARVLEQEIVLVAINLSDDELELVLPVWQFGFEGGKAMSLMTEKQDCIIDGGEFRLVLSPLESQIIRLEHTSNVT